MAQQVGENARALRLAQNLSRKTLAERAGVSESTIKRFETTGQITQEALVLLASSLGGMLLMDRLFLREHPDTGAIE
ncbi:helix-turn-helix domain-containing protein [Metapseudomonas furukawaii]|uniref:helix-turn-helix domain-containing protein n=1 Tax=Metapseudomonas furukawaii TaxID=1149133 RepID=UPI00227B9306|nr:helix-turn-helix transcriptional regulator [Pseudomonas furukawaii]WAG78764.1 helix-turn-helix domain-containing protein [Pseudomonas furukawaii]